MKQKLFTLFLALIASIGIASAQSGTCGNNLTWTLSNGTLTISGTGAMADYSYNAPWYVYRSAIKTILINDGVTSIGNYAFQDCPSLTSVTIGNSVTSIGYRAFENCSSLTSMTIPNSVTSIGEAAFSGCSSLTSVTIPNSVTSIGSSAFSRCSSLSSITIPNSVTSIGSSAFEGCSKITSVTWNAKNCNSYNFGSQVASFEFGNEVEVIPNSLCEGMEKLTSITIPNSVTSIGRSAFLGCSSLTSITIPNSVTSIGESAFHSCSGLTSITIPNSVTSIGRSAFNGCTSLTSVTIPNSVTSIGIYAFYNCSSLTSVEAPAIFFEINEEYWVYITKSLQKVVVNSGELSENALAVINRSYKTLQSLDLSGVTNTEFADEAFKGCYNLKSLVLPSTLTRVSYMMVAECVYLENINIPATVEEIGDRAFEDCRSIQTITFSGAVPASVLGQANAPMAGTSALKKIGNWAFYNAHQLQNLEIPEGVTEIGDGAFYGCTYMEELTLPASVQSIGDNCFALCSKLTKIKCAAVVPPAIQAKTFYEVKRQIPVYVPDEAVANYKGDMYWQEFNIQAASQQDSQGIENVQGDEVQSTKVVKDGQVLILRNGKTYTMQGQEVK